MEGSERDSNTTLGSWVSVSGNQEDHVMSLGGSSSSSSVDGENDSSHSPTEHQAARHEMLVDDDDTAAATPGESNSTQLITHTSNANDDNDENDDNNNDGGGKGSNMSSGFAIPAARPLMVEYDAEVPPASGGGTQRRRKGHLQQQQQQQQDDANQSQSQHPPTQPPPRIRRRGTQNSSILLNPLYMFSTFTIVAYLMRPNSSQISVPDTDAAFGSKFYDDPWDQGEEFRDRSPIPEKLKRKQARTEKALAAKRKKMEEEEEEARRKNATSSANEDDEDEVEGVSEDESEEDEVDSEQKDKQGEEISAEEASAEDTRSANVTKSETKANVTNVTTYEAVVDPFPQLYDWQNWTTGLANESISKAFNDPIFLWFAPQSGGGAFVKILEDCYEGINITRSQWWRDETPDDADTADTAAGAISWWWQHDTAPLESSGHPKGGRLPIMATTNLLEAAASAFNSSAGQGRCISLVMHPIERAMRSYYHHRMLSSRAAKRTTITTGNATSNMTLAEYAQGPFADENRLVRSIVDRNISEALQWEDLEVATDFVTRKCLVGIIGDKRSLLIRTVSLVEMALGLTKRERNSTRCTAERIDEWADSMHDISSQRIDLPSEDEEAWGALMRKNAYDMKLYEKVTELFANQTSLLNETIASRPKVKSTADIQSNGGNDQDRGEISMAENKRKANSGYTNVTDTSDGVRTEALDNSDVEDNDGEMEEEEEEEEEERADDDEENRDASEIDRIGENDEEDNEATNVEDKAM